MGMTNGVVSETSTGESDKSVAQKLCCPMIPDERPDDWVKVGDTVVLCLIDCNKQETHRQLRLTTGTVTQCKSAVIDGNGKKVAMAGIVASIPHPEDVDWPMDTCEYDVCSPYIMKPEDAQCFRENPNDLRNWLNRCGETYTDFKINDELKQAFERAFAAN